MQNRLFSIHVWPLTCFVTLMVCGLCSCDTSIKKRASTTQGMSWEQLTRAGGDAPPLAEIRSGAPFEYCDPPRIETGMMDALGRPVTVSCASCHGNLPPDPHRSSADELREFHSGLTYNHGGEQPLSCLSCHRAENYNQLRLVDGRPLEFYQSRSLCAQCHAKQNRDYEHGAHGGMTGYWDRQQGAVVRKTCVDCHDPHSPKFPAMHPTFKPLDRFLPDSSPSHSGGAHD